MTQAQHAPHSFDAIAIDPRTEHRKAKSALAARVLAASPSLRTARAVLREFSALTDATLRALWRDSGLGKRCALLAVGGYGRRELFPHSDVDVLVLVPERVRPANATALRDQVESFIHACWDSGLEIGSSVRTVAECMDLARQDVTVQTTLLDARRLAGSRTLAAGLRARFDTELDALEFLVAKQLEMQGRHLKYGNTPYALEPNCKESPGGLRDLQLMAWAARAAHLGQRWEDLRASGLVTDHELRQIRHGEALLMLLRIRLHLIAGRHEDRLAFDLQQPLAESLAVRPRTTASGRVTLRASEVLMRRYYRAVKSTVQLRQIVLQLIEERLRTAHGHPAAPMRRIDTDFLDRSGLLEVESDTLYQREPDKILATFLVYARVPGIKGLSAHTLRALHNARTVMGSRFRADPVNHAQFLAILQQDSGVTGALRLMNETSVLGAYLAPFRRIVGQMQHDLFHAYTVDQHILTVVRNVRRFFSAEHAHEFPLCSQLAAGWDQPWILCVAALFHDIAKGRGGNHSVSGAHEAHRFCRAHGVAHADARLIEFLVHEHLTMSRVAQQQDLSDERVITAFAERVGNVRRLIGLYLLTVADIRGTGPTIWSAWKGKLLETLYHATVAVLGGWAPSGSARVEAHKRDARSLLAATRAPGDAIERLWSTLGPAYFLRENADEIAWHARHIAASASGATLGTALVRARQSTQTSAQLMIYTRDRAELFARICSFFDRSSCSILDARIHTTSEGHALDTFEVAAPSGLAVDGALLENLERGLTQALESSAELPAPRLGRASTQARSFPIRPRVDINPDEDGTRWLLSVTATDRTGVLYAIARILTRFEIDLESAKVMTLGDRVEDVFLLRGAPLANPWTRFSMERALVDALGMLPDTEHAVPVVPALA